MRPFYSQTGHSIMEVLISSTLGAIVLAGVFDLYVSTQKSAQGQTNQVLMRTDTKTAMNYMAKELRLMYGAPTITTTTTANDTITFVRIEESGYSSGGNTATTFKDSIKNWKVNAFAPTASGSYSVRIITGQGVGELHPILSNTAGTLTLSDAGWAVLPDTTSLYYIVRNKAFRRQADNTLRYQVQNGPFNLLAANVTTLTFSQPDPKSVSIVLAARTQTVDPRTGKYATFTLSDTVRGMN